MTAQEITALLDAQRAFYHSGATIPVAFRRAQLKKLHRAVKTYEDEIAAALHADLGKSAYEGYMCESGMGRYHGKAGFDAFSHTKSIVDKKTWLDLPMRYQPYRRGWYEKLLRLFLR